MALGLRLGIGLTTAIGAALVAFTADTTAITADSTTRTADEE